MKRSLSILLASLLLAVGLTACGNNDKKPANTPTDNTVTEEPKPHDNTLAQDAGDVVEGAGDVVEDAVDGVKDGVKDAVDKVTPDTDPSERMKQDAHVRDHNSAPTDRENDTLNH